MASQNPSYEAAGASPFQNGLSSLSVSLAEFNAAMTSATSSATPESGEEAVARFRLETLVAVLTTVVCVVGNSLILVVGALTSAFENFNRCYLFSLTIADLALGLFVTPFCIFNTIFHQWVFKSDILCCVEAYLLALFVVVSMVSLAFLIVDHYVAVRKPDRYPVMMSFNRSLCWIVLTWVIAVSFCCPPLFSLQRAFYYEEAYVCMIDAEKQQTYFMTVACMVSLPATVAVLITSRYLFTHAFQDQKAFYQRVYEYFSERTWNYYITFIIAVMYFITWLPFTVMRVAQHVTGSKLEGVPPEIHFYCMWFGLSNCFTKFLVYLFMSPQFRQGLREVCDLRGGGRGGGYALCGQGGDLGGGAGASSSSSPVRGRREQDPEVIVDPKARRK